MSVSFWNRQLTARLRIYETIEIPAPKFELYEEVIIFWNERELPGKVIKRWLDLDERFYGYQIYSSDRLYPENVIVAR